MKTFAEIAFTPAVQALQQVHGSRATYARMQAEAEAEPGEGLGPRESAFLAAADSFFLATVSESGWPYVQHRGGPPGFIRTITPNRIAWPEFRGNRQYVSTGNLQNNDRASLIVMDHANRQRLKLLGRLQVQEIGAAAPDRVRLLELPAYRARTERVAQFEVEAFDWNCPQHITPRYTLEQIGTASLALRERVRELEEEVAALRRNAVAG